MADELQGKIHAKAEAECDAQESNAVALSAWEHSVRNSTQPNHAKRRSSQQLCSEYLPLVVTHFLRLSPLNVERILNF